MIDKIKEASAIRARRHPRQPTDGNTQRFKKYILDMIAGPINTNDCDNEPLIEPQPTVEPTFSIVELPNDVQDTDQPEAGEANIYDIPACGVTANTTQ